MDSERGRQYFARWPVWLIRLLLGFLIFMLLALLTSFANYGLAINLGREVRYSNLFLDHLGRWQPWALMVPLVGHLLDRFPFSRREWLKPLSLHIALSLTWLPIYLFLIIAFEIPRGRLTWSVLASEYEKYFGLNIFGDYHWYWIVVIALTAFHFGRDLVQQRREKAALLLKNTQLQKNLVESQLQALKAQLQPHFLYNTHNTISALIRNDESERALKVLNLLSRLLRRSLESGVHQTTTLGEELAFVDDYLAIQTTRFPDSLRVQIDVDEACGDVVVPAMILQPLVENAVNHGLVSNGEGDTIQLRAGKEDHSLVIRILNRTGPESKDSSGFGIGLKNTRARLHHLYGEEHVLELEYLEPTMIAATIKLPLRTE